MTCAQTATTSPGEAGAIEASCKDVVSLDKLNEITTCGLTAQSVQGEVTTVCVCQQALGHWPPALCQFTSLTSINLSGNAITFIPQSVQKLQGLQQLLMARNALGSLPPEISALTALTELDVGSNNIRKLPDGLCKLTGLKVLNAWGNQLTCLPDGFGGLTSLIRLGLKGNQLTALPHSFCQLGNLVELFLTDNKLTGLPQGFGALKSLVKLQASYNPLQSLPDDLWQLPGLELFRLAVGGLKHWPAHLDGLPRLAWCSLGSNPAAADVPALPDLPRVKVSDLVMGSKLGQGASGEVFEGTYQGQPVAVKLFLPGASPDGSTREEIAITCSNRHANLTQVIAVVVDDSDDACSDSDDVIIKGLVMGLVRGQPMADRPTSQHLLRCKWPADQTYSSSQVVNICSGLADALGYLHSKGVCHGDVYAHNIMLEGESRAVLCDFGAAFCYDTSAAGGFWEAMEMRAFGLFMQGLLQHVRDPVCEVGDAAHGTAAVQQQLQELVGKCLADAAAERPAFSDLLAQLQALKA